MSKHLISNWHSLPPSSDLPPSASDSAFWFWRSINLITYLLTYCVVGRGWRAASWRSEEASRRVCPRPASEWWRLQILARWRVADRQRSRKQRLRRGAEHSVDVVHLGQNISETWRQQYVDYPRRFEQIRKSSKETTCLYTQLNYFLTLLCGF